MVPHVGDRVTRGDSDTVYLITRVNPEGTEVRLLLEGTNLEHFHGPASTLKYVETVSRAASKPSRSTANIGEVMERVHAVQHSAIDHLSGELAILKST